MLTKTVALLLGVAQAWRPGGLEEGKCPFAPGTLQSKVKDLDAKKLKGTWINIWDEKKPNEDYVCMGTKFEEMMEDGKVANMLKYSTSNGMTDEHKQELLDDEHPSSQSDYFIFEGRQITFPNSGDKSVGTIEYTKVHEANHKNSVETGTFNPYVFDSQYMRYYQVLDTDYDNYMLIYTCQEINEYHNIETGADLIPQDVWDLAEKTVKGKTIEYTYPEKLVKVTPVYKHKVQVLWRARKKDVMVPKYKQSQQSPDGEMVKIEGDLQSVYTYDHTMDLTKKSKINDLKALVTEIIDHPQFSSSKLDKKYAFSKIKMEGHFEVEKKGKTKEVKKKYDCDFDPYEQTRETFAKLDAKIVNETAGETEHTHHMKRMEWSLYKHAEFAHDAPFVYLDEVAHMHAEQIQKEDAEFYEKYKPLDDSFEPEAKETTEEKAKKETLGRHEDL